MTEFLRKLKAWRRRDTLEAELLEEIHSHLAMKAEETGNWDVARRRFGNTAVVLQDARGAWSWPRLEELWQDVRYGFRMLLRNPGFTVVAVISLAVGVGGNTAIFSLVDRVLIRKLPVDEPDRLAIASISSGGGVRTAFSYPDFADYRDRNQVFEGIACYAPRPLTLSNAGQAERIQGMIVSGNYFDVLRVHPALGRGFLPEEDKIRGQRAVVVLAYSFWQRRFGAEAALIGKTITLNGYNFMVVGIAPPHFGGTMRGIQPDVYVPVMMQGQVSPGWKIDPLFGPRSRSLAWLEVIGRLKGGVTLDQAAAAMTALAAGIVRANPNADGTPRAEPKFVLAGGSHGQTSLVKDLRFPLQLLMATAGLILAITCANVASLLLARASTRGKEIGIRLAAGAGRPRLIRQLLTESLLLAMLGGASGLLLAASLTRLLVRYAPTNVAAAAIEHGLDLRVLGFTFALSLLTGLLFGLAPALIATRADLAPVLKEAAISFGTRPRRLTLRNLLIVGQVALSTVLLIGAGLCVRSLKNLQSIDAGFDIDKVLLLSADVSLSGYSNERGLRFYSELTERVGRLPGVEAASVGALVPLGSGFGMNFVPRIEGYVPRPGEDVTFDYNIVGTNYFRTMKIPLAQGREFGALDTSSAAKVAIVNQTAARRFWPGQNPIGRRLADSRAFFDTAPKEIVGVVKDSKYRQLVEDVRPTIYVPLSQDYRSGISLHVRTAGDPASMLRAVRREVEAMDPALPLYDVKTLQEQKSGSLYTQRITTALLTLFGLLALLLAAVGLYGVVAFAVTRRTREIGIRLALGAQDYQVRQLIMREGMLVLLTGLVLGLGAAIASTRVLKSFLFGVAPADAVSFAGAALLLTSVSALANYLPALRASRTDPLVALKV